jgi:hypothetical protein
MDEPGAEEINDFAVREANAEVPDGGEQVRDHGDGAPHHAQREGLAF